MTPTVALESYETLVLYSILMAMVGPSAFAILAPRVRMPLIGLVLVGIATGATTFLGMGALLRSAPDTLHRPLLDALFLLPLQVVFVAAWVRTRSAPDAAAVDAAGSPDRRLHRQGALVIAVFVALFAGHVATVIVDPASVAAAFRVNAGLTAILALATLWTVRGPGVRS